MIKWILLLVIVGGIVGFRSCNQSDNLGEVKITFGDEKPYANIDDLRNWGVPSTKVYECTACYYPDENTIIFEFNTHNKDLNSNLIDKSIEEIKYLTKNLRKTHTIIIKHLDGRPCVKFNGEPIGTGKIVHEFTLPKE